MTRTERTYYLVFGLYNLWAWFLARRGRFRGGRGDRPEGDPHRGFIVSTSS
jgi:hypothetical protein